MKTITMYELLGMVKDGKAPKKIKVGNKIYNYETFNIGKGDNYFTAEWREVKGYRINYDGTYYYLEIRDYNLNDEVEILEEEIGLNANSVEFNINNDKRDCIVTLDENDLGIDKLHLENCYFYKENDKWYVKKYDFKNFNLEEKEIPEKLEILPDNDHYSNEVLYGKINEIIDYLKSKGDE